MTASTVVVIGAGVGGLTAANHLARAGMRVTVLERHAEPGGRCARRIRDGHYFDIGPTLLVMPRLYESEFRALGSSIHDRLALRPVDPTYRLVFDDGSQLALSADGASLRAQVEACEPGSFAPMQRYLREGGRHYELVVEDLVKREFRRLTDIVSLRTLRLLLGTKPFTNHYRHVAAAFESPRLRSALTFQDLYVGLSPFEAPATLSFLSYTELAHGVWYPRGGMYSIIEALVDLARNAGVEFAFDAPVAEITTQGNRARGVKLADGSRVSADAVIANADLPWVYRHLLPPERTAERLSAMRFSSSTISFFWGVDKTYERIGPHTLFLPDDYRENFDAITRDLTLAPNPSVYVHAPARVYEAMAPLGEDTLTAIVPVGHLRDHDSQDWDALRDQARTHVFRRLRTMGVNDLEAHIKFEESYTPPSWAVRQNLERGATHGLSHHMTQMACFRPSNRHRRYHNLYFAGASTHPGTGVPTSMVSGRFAAQRLVADMR